MSRCLRRCAGNITPSSSGVPRTFIGGKVYVGFSSSEGDLVYNQGYRAYIGYANQIEKSIQECLYGACSSLSDQVVDISKKSPEVGKLIMKDSWAKSTKAFVNGTYLVGWWSSERMSSKLDYPDLLVYINGMDGSIIKTVVPSERVPGLDKPGQAPSGVFILLSIAIMVYLLLFLFMRGRLKWSMRLWVSGFVVLLIITFFVLAVTTPVSVIERFAKTFSIPCICLYNSPCRRVQSLRFHRPYRSPLAFDAYEVQTEDVSHRQRLHFDLCFHVFHVYNGPDPCRLLDVQPVWFYSA